MKLANVWAIRCWKRGLGAALLLTVQLLTGASAHAELPAPLSAQTLKAPNGPSAQKGLGESFSASLSTGTGAYRIPLDVPPALLKPSLALVYAAGQGKSEYGLSFRLPVLEIRRTTDKGSPTFTEQDRFAVEGSAGGEELVPVDASRRYYRAKVEGGYVLYERDVAENRWIVHAPDGGTAILGGNEQSREQARGNAFRWRISEQRDVWGHRVVFEYRRDGGRLYPKTISYQLDRADPYVNRVEFEYEPRSDVYTDYSYGIAITTSLRTSRITMWQGRTGGRALRQYDLGYESEQGLSLLTSVKLTGEGGTTLPTLQLAYLKPSALRGDFVTMSRRPPTEGLVTGLATLEDVNADGLPDLLVGEAGNYRYYENLDGVRWSSNPTPLLDSPGLSLNDSGVVLMDADGDGFRDVAYVQASYFRYHPGGWIEQGTARGFRSRVDAAAGASGATLTDARVRLVDLNSDGRTDLLVSRVGTYDSIVLNDAVSGLKESSIAKLPADAPFTDRLVSLFDFNGDGVLDLVRADYAQRRMFVWYGLGRGEYGQAHLIVTPEGDSSEFHLADVNRDGQTDLVRHSGSQ
ncbi:MAG TPA: FG-GAP-like repeat-containing protein, partial [Polyangiaceae bacterium]|nr:FG-GAP-like repeat-containing protein [Polyangiaceae bacterium]